MLLDTLTESLITTSSNIIFQRNLFVEQLKPYFIKYYSLVSGKNESVSLKYIANSIGEKSLDTKENIQSSLFDNYNIVKDSEIRRGTTLFGPQKDELLISINNGIAKEFASQGQHKSLLISLKFAEFEYLKDILGETPIILLDDIFSELDDRRSKLVFDIIQNHKSQTFITITEQEKLDRILHSEINYQSFEVDQGEVLVKS